MNPKISDCPLYKTVVSICYCYSFQTNQTRVNHIESITAQAESITALTDTPADQILTALICETFGVGSIEQAIKESREHYDKAVKVSKLYWDAFDKENLNHHQKLAEKEVLKWLKERK